MASRDPAILAATRVGPEIGNLTFRGEESILEVEGQGQGPAGDASLFGGPFPPRRLGHPGPPGYSRGGAGA